jgi:hypothetical protein
MSGVTLWVPAADDPKWPCVFSWFGMRVPPPHRCRLIRSRPDAIELVWNAIVSDFLRGGDEWLFSCHNDIVFAPGTLERLMSWQQPLVSALVICRKPPHLPFVYREWDGEHRALVQVEETAHWILTHPGALQLGPCVLEPRPEDALVRADFASTACVLIQRDVLAAIEPPWFQRDAPTEGGEDRYFYEKAAAAGYTLYVDRSCLAGHLPGEHPVGVLDFLAWQHIAQQEERDGANDGGDITQGVENRV